MNAADTCRERGWGPGTILIGDPPCVIRITAVGDDRILAREMHRGEWTREGIWNLHRREWREWWIHKQPPKRPTIPWRRGVPPVPGAYLVTVGGGVCAARLYRGCGWDREGVIAWSPMPMPSEETT